MKEGQSKEKKEWGWAKYVFIGFCLFILIIFLFAFFSSSPPKEEKVYSLDLNELYGTFGKESQLSEVQKENLFNEKLKGRLVKITMRADRVNKASLSSNYVVLEMKDQFSCIAKAFFPSSEKEKLNRINLGNEITFVGRMTTYKYGLTSCINFEDSRILEIK